MRSDAWPEAPLASRLLRIEGGRSPDLPDTPAVAGGWGVLKVSAVHTSGFRPGENKAVHDIALIDERYEVRAGDLLISRANTPELVGSACIATPSSSRFMLSDKTLRIVVDQKLADPQFVSLCLAAPAVRVQIENAASGSSRSMQNISQLSIERLMLPWPTLREQQRIVEVLASVSAVEKSIEASIAKTRIVSSAVTDNMLDGLEWKHQLSDVLSGSIRNGFSPVESQAWTGVQMLGLGCLTKEGFQPRQLKNAPVSVATSHPAVLSEGDLLMSRANTRELIGLAGIYRDVGSPCIYPDLMMRLRTADGMRPEFLEAVLRSPRTRRRIKSLAQGTSESMVKISAPAVERLLVPAPSLAAQDKFLSDRNALAGQIDVDLRELEKLRKVKQGLADDLLAGRDTQPRLG